jgi:hypothetical protein
MANRGVTGSLKTETEKQAVTYHTLVEILFDTPIRVTDAPRDITHDSNTYLAVGGILSFDEITENVSFEIPDVNITFSGLPFFDNSNRNLSTELQTADYTEKDVRILRHYSDLSGSTVGAFEVYKGRVQKISMAADMETATVVVETASHWGDFDRENGRFTNENSQKAIFSGDEGLQFARDIQKEIEWKP